MLNQHMQARGVRSRVRQGGTQLENAMVCGNAPAGCGAARRRGFTLLQMLLALAIIAILATLSFAAFSHSRVLVRRAECDARMKAVILALDAYRQEHGQYPKHLS